MHDTNQNPRFCFFFSLGIGKFILNVIEVQNPRNVETVLKKNKYGGLKIPEFKAIAKLQELRQYH